MPTTTGWSDVCTAYYTIHAIRFGPRAWVEELAVDPELRSRGIGSRLLAAAKDWARERGASHLKLDSALARTEAHRFYERGGAERPLLQLRLRALRVEPRRAQRRLAVEVELDPLEAAVHDRPHGRAWRLDLDAPGLRPADLVTRLTTRSPASIMSSRSIR